MDRKYREFGVALSGSGYPPEERSRIDRLLFVLGFIQARVGSLRFLKSLHDHEGFLTPTVYDDRCRPEDERAVVEAWAACGEEEVEFKRRSSPCEFCKHRL